MLTAEARHRLTIVLVGARNPQNIGAAARAMQDFGFGDLRVVNEFAPPFEAAQLEATSAVGAAADIMQAARLFAGLAEALQDCSLVAGTTAIGGRNLDAAVLPLADAGALIAAALGASPEDSRDSDGKVALLFGSEKTGLTGEQLSFCTHLLTIPMFAAPGRHLSMNLGQAVAVCLYELSREGYEGSRPLPERHTPSATVADRERLTGLLEGTMQASGYSQRFPANARTIVVRRLAMQLGVTSAEATTWMGILRLVLDALRKPRPGV